MSLYEQIASLVERCTFWETLHLGLLAGTVIILLVLFGVMIGRA